MKSFAGKVAAITGAGSGIGRALAIALARRGCAVALSDIDEVGLAETAKLAQNTTRGASNVLVTKKRVDVANRDAVRAWAESVAEEHGGCNIVINNAGIAYSSTAEGADITDFEHLLDVDFWGVVHGTQAFLPFLKASGDGHVVNVSSLFGLIGFPGHAVYNAAKFAVRGYTEALRMELEIMGAPVSATSVHPGGVKTNIAKATKAHPSIRDLGVTDIEASKKQFEIAFRMSPDDAAETILRGIQKNARRVLVGNDAKFADGLQRLVPGSYHALIAFFGRRVLSASRRRQPRSAEPARDERPRRAVVDRHSN